MDVYELKKYRADFALGETAVTRFANYRQGVKEELLRYFFYFGIKLKGILENIGSCDGSKVGKLNEIDNLYVWDFENMIPKEYEDRCGCFFVSFGQTKS